MALSVTTFTPIKGSRICVHVRACQQQLRQVASSYRKPAQIVTHGCMFNKIENSSGDRARSGSRKKLAGEDFSSKCP